MQLYVYLNQQNSQPIPQVLMMKISEWQIKEQPGLGENHTNMWSVIDIRYSMQGPVSEPELDI